MVKHDPVADPKSTVTGPNWRITVLTSQLIRYEYSPDGAFEDRASTFVINRLLPVPPFQVSRHKDGSVDIHTEKLHIEYDGKPLSSNGFTVAYKVGPGPAKGDVGSPYGRNWRYGVSNERSGLKGTSRTLDDVDGRMKLEDGLMSTVGTFLCLAPYAVTLQSTSGADAEQSGFSTIDDSISMIFTQDDWVASRVPGRTDGYLFAYNLDHRGGLKALSSISGTQPMIPRWTLGNWWSKFCMSDSSPYPRLRA
jgi:hypothetical protein